MVSLHVSAEELPCYFEDIPRIWSCLESVKNDIRFFFIGTDSPVFLTSFVDAM